MSHFVLSEMPSGYLRHPVGIKFVSRICRKHACLCQPLGGIRTTGVDEIIQVSDKRTSKDGDLRD